ncbi:MAG: cyclic nucleotide-binding domain-containing protein [Chloroflexota bacterium]
MDAQQNHPFWEVVNRQSDPAYYKPHRRRGVEVVRLKYNEESYYVLKQPETKSYLRLSESDYALYWQMNGRRTIKDLLFYSLKRYQTLPIGHLNGLIADLKEGGFLHDEPVNLYEQLREALEALAPAGRGKRILEGFLHSEFTIDGLEDFFNPLYRQTRFLYGTIGQLALLFIVLFGGALFGLGLLSQMFELAPTRFSVGTFILANLFVIFIHELAHGLTVKFYGRELNRGGFLIYWGFPAFFVDTRDTWMLPSRARIAVSWAGPYSGMLMGGLAGLILTAVNLPALNLTIPAFWEGFIAQIGFVGYLTAFINLNPLLELDGYFMLMDWLEMPGLRARAFEFWRETVRPRLRETGSFRNFSASLDRAERAFFIFGALAFVYSIYALGLAVYFWRSRIGQFFADTWESSNFWGKLGVLALTAVILGPLLYYLFHYGWSQIQRGLEWLSNRNLLSRPDVLAFLIGAPIITSIGTLFFFLGTFPYENVGGNLLIGLLYLTAVGALIVVARQLPGSEFQYALWTLAAAPVALILGWLNFTNTFWVDFSLMLFAVLLIGAGFAAWLTVGPEWLDWSDRGVMGLMILAGPLSYLTAVTIQGDFAGEWWRWLTTALIHLGVFLGLMFKAPLLINFYGSRFWLSWLVLVLAIMLSPWVQFAPQLHLIVAGLWLFGALHYLLVGALAQFSRVTVEEAGTAIYDDRTRLVTAFNAFLSALFDTYETVFGGRRLALIESQLQNLRVLDPDATIIQIGDRAQKALLLAVDRLDDLAGTPFTRAAGQAAYDSLPWLQSETLARYVLSGTKWGSQLSSGFVNARDRRLELLRRADIFAGFDNAAVESTYAIAERWSGRNGVVMARQGQNAGSLYLIEEGEVDILHNEQPVGKLEPGGYFGTNALLDQGAYQFTYRTKTRVKALVIDRHKFDPLLRADTTLSNQVNSGADERRLLKKMPLFSSLSPQQLATIDARLQHKRVKAGELIVEQGEPRSNLFIVVSGAVDVLLESESETVRVGRLGEGEHFGEYALFADTPYQATYKAVEDTKLLLLDEPKFDELVLECDRMSHYVEQIGSGRLVSTKRRMGITAVIS